MGGDFGEEEAATLPLDPDGGDEVYQRFMAAIHPRLGGPGYRKRNGPLTRRPDHFYALCRLMKECGQRISDATMIEPDKISIENGRCGTYTFRQRKTKRITTIYPTLELTAVLKALPKIHGPYVFYDGRANHKKFIVAQVNQPMEQIAGLVGLDGIRPHRFRDQFALDMWVKHRSFDLIKELLGHKDVRTTQHYYQRWCKARETAMVDTLYPQTPVLIEMPKQQKGRPG